MSFDWCEFIKLAEELGGWPVESSRQCGNEARLRTAISRAYYAAHMNAVRLLISKYDYTKAQLSSHERVHSALIEGFPRGSPQKKAGLQLTDIKVHRVDADYEDVFPGSLEHQKNRVLKKATKIIDSLKKLQKK